MSGLNEEFNAKSIIHIDMDCFYAAIEIRENPSFKDQPVAVGGSTAGRGVLTTCNYIAREYGCRSAMPSFKALQLCPNLIILPVRHDLYKSESKEIREIFKKYTDLIEPLSLDEAYLDVSEKTSNPYELARDIRNEIFEKRNLTCSAGIAPNKMLAKIASDWNKPNGQFEVKNNQIDDFMKKLPVNKIWGVGGKTSEKLLSLDVTTCSDLQQFDIVMLHKYFGKFGTNLYKLCRGIDDRIVISNRERKSCSVERTFTHNVMNLDHAQKKLHHILLELKNDVTHSHGNRKIRSAFIKLKFSNFTKTTSEKTSSIINSDLFNQLLQKSWYRGKGRPVRLIGAGVRFYSDKNKEIDQLELF
ncbi:MAG: DNA polymerase IV [Verrucomicrobiales bacterium]